MLLSGLAYDVHIAVPRSERQYKLPQVRKVCAEFGKLLKTFEHHLLLHISGGRMGNGLHRVCGAKEHGHELSLFAYLIVKVWCECALDNNHFYMKGLVCQTVYLGLRRCDGVCHRGPNDTADDLEDAGMKIIT